VSLNSTTLPASQVNEYAETVIAPQISTINGVSQVAQFGGGSGSKYAVRVQLETSGIAFKSAFAIEAHCQRARRLFREAELSHPEASELEAIINRLSIFDALAISARSSHAAYPGSWK